MCPLGCTERLLTPWHILTVARRQAVCNDTVIISATVKRRKMRVETINLLKVPSSFLYARFFIIMNYLFNLFSFYMGGNNMKQSANSLFYDTVSTIHAE